jgi:hypothetical protein
MQVNMENIEANIQQRRANNNSSASDENANLGQLNNPQASSSSGSMFTQSMATSVGAYVLIHWFFFFKRLFL